MNTGDPAVQEVEAQLRAGLASVMPGAADQAFVADLAADVALLKVRAVIAVSDEQRAVIMDGVEVLKATWKIRLAEKELMAHDVVEKIVKTIGGLAMGILFPHGTVVGIVAQVVVSRLTASNDGTS